MAGLGWCDWIMGLLTIIWDALSQRVYAVTLPPRLQIISLPHITCIITSCASGVGLETARHLAKSGAHVVFAVQNTDAIKELIEKWEGKQSDGRPPLNCEVMEVDFLSFDSLRNFAETWEARKLPLNVLINTADTFYMDGSQRFSKEGCEYHMQVNHLAPALLTLLLLPSLLRGSPSRVVMVNSIAHHVGYFDSDDLISNSTKRKYNKTSAFANSKLAQLLFSNLLQRRLPREAGVDIICVHPGQVTRDATQDSPGILQFARKLSFFLFSPAEGARSVVFSATDKQIQDYARALRGLGYPVAPYFGSDCKPCSVARQACDMEKAHLVWQETLKLLGLPMECIEVALSGSDPVEVSGDITVIESFPEIGSGENFDYLMDDGDDSDDCFSDVS